MKAADFAAMAEVLDRYARATTPAQWSELNLDFHLALYRSVDPSTASPVATPGTDVRVVIRARDPKAPNHRGETPSVARVDLIAGEITVLNLSVR